jgi:hypothetical protein
MVERRRFALAAVVGRRGARQPWLFPGLALRRAIFSHDA